MTDGNVNATIDSPFTRDRGTRTDEAPRAELRRDGRSVGDLLKELSREGSELVREEVALARTELSEKIGVFERNGASIAIGGGLLLAALLMAAEALSRGLAVLLGQWLGLEVSVWLSPLILTLVFAGIGYAMIKKGAAAIRREGVTPHKTVNTLKQDRNWAERKVSP